ncbi:MULTISPECIES: hypothetical protein [unclassified Streptomyces]|uniref:hypothetical protein n=1 Tax=unclassified Streptomyces TaxID=2593676 RepID=UPI00278C5C09|nr:MULTISPECIES: hypothetical protein [unclassified Streptomyces]
MHGQSLHQVLVDGFRRVSELLDRTSSTLAADPVLDQLAAHVDAAPESADTRKALSQVLDSWELPGVTEFIQYFGHRFRWDWLRREVEAGYRDSVTRPNRRLTRHYERMLESFSDDWEDKDLFPSLDRF